MFRSSATTRDLSQGLANWLEKKRWPATYRRADDQGTISSPVAPPGLKFLPCCPAAKMTDKRRPKSADRFFRFENLKKDLDKLSTGVSVHAMAIWQRLWCLSDSGLPSASLPAFSVVKLPPGMCWVGSA